MENERSIGRSVGGRSRLAEQKRDGRDRWRADRSAWRHRAEARRVKAGRSVSRLSDAIMPLATTVRNVSVAPRHTSLAFCTTSPFAHTARHASPAFVYERNEKKDDYFERNAEMWILCGYTVRHLPEPSSFYYEPSMAWQRSEALCNEVKRSKMVCSARGDLRNCPARIRWKMCDRSRGESSEESVYASVRYVWCVQPCRRIWAIWRLLIAPWKSLRNLESECRRTTLDKSQRNRTEDFEILNRH